MLWKVIAVLGALLILPARSAPGSDFKKAVENLADYSFDSAAVAHVSDFELNLPYGMANFKEGKFYFCAFIDDEPTAMYFDGIGTFYYYPPDEIEIQQVRRFYDEDTLNLHFDRAYFAFADIKAWFDSLPKTESFNKPKYRTRTSWEQMIGIPDNAFKYDLPLNIVQARFDGQKRFLWADFADGKFNHTVYHFDPYDNEEISLFKYSPEFISPQLVSSYPADEPDWKKEIKRRCDLFRYDFDLELSTYARSDISCKMSLEVEQDSLKTVDFAFPDNYKIDRIWGDVLDSLSFFKKKDRPGLMIELSRVVHKGDTVTVGLDYRTNLFDHFIRFGVVQKRLTRWYPYQGYRQLSDYSMRYSLDKGYRFISVGDLVSDSVEGGRLIFHYATADPVAYISLNYGVFDSIEVKNPELPITIYILPGINDSPIFGNPNLEKTSEDVSGSFQFYREHFAPYRFKRLDVAAMAVMYGQGSPGVVHLPYIVFSRSLEGYDDKLRAHEVAHQWWGHIVNPATYRDVWLSEGLAEYSAAMYIEQGKKRPDIMWQVLNQWHKDIVESGKAYGKRSVGYKAGALFLGERLKSELSQGDFIVLIYSKAAYMLHMLRYEIETVPKRPGAFMEMLSEFAHRNYNKLTFTDDFIDLAREYLGERTDSFFDQWLFDWRIPKIKKGHEISKDGTAILNLEVKEVDADFASYYPVRFDFNNRTSIMVHYLVSSGENSFEFSPPPGKEITKVYFNPNKDILEK